mmetsp:Transcript_12452/g.33979  ORF Transcript_12452/g.33979 Transcript_12452/m.33979 type:complete len:568 (-) Transcript_12452:607-2310(-)
MRRWICGPCIIGVFLLTLYLLLTLNNVVIEQNGSKFIPGDSMDQLLPIKLKVVISYVLYSPVNSTQPDHFQCLQNTNFFVHHGVTLNDTTNLFVFSLIGNTKAPLLLRKASFERPNVVRIRHAQYASSDQVAHAIVFRRYFERAQNFMMINCGARGPYFSSLSGNRTWLDLFRNKIDNDVKLVGPTISCESRPHVQSYAMMTDRFGASALIKMWSHFSNYSHKQMIEEGEVAYSTVLLRSGWNIASLESRRADHDYRIGVCDPEFAYLNNSIFANPTVCRTQHSPGCQGLEPCEVVFVKNGGAVLLHKMMSQNTLFRMAAEEAHGDGQTCSLGYIPVRPFLELKEVFPSPLEIYNNVRVTVIIRAHALYFHQLLSFLHSLAAVPQAGILALVIAMDAHSQLLLERAVTHFSSVGTPKTMKAHILTFPEWLYNKHEKTLPVLCSIQRINELRGLGYPEEHIHKFCFINSPLHYVLTDLALLYTLKFVHSCKRILVSNADNTYSPLFFSALLSEENDKYDVITTNSILKGGLLFVRPEKGRIDLGSYAVSPGFLKKNWNYIFIVTAYKA